MSSEGVAVQVESMFALLWGIILSFIFSWPIALCGLLITPFIIIASAAAAKADNKTYFNAGEDEQKEKTKDQ